MDTQTLVRDVFQAMLPSSDETLFLKACLSSGQRAREAWQVYCQEAIAARSGMQNGRVFGPMAPLLFSSARRNGLPVHKKGLTYLRTAYLNEQLRTKVYTAILSELLATLERHEVPVILSGAGALARTVYTEPALRHCHDIELLVEAKHVARAVQILLTSGFELPKQREPTAAHATLLIHSSGLPLELRRGIFVGRRLLTPPRLWARCRHGADLNVSLLPLAESLLCAGIRGFIGPDSRSVQWVADAWHLLASSGGIDWDYVTASVRRSPYALPLYLALGYLRREFEADVPSATLRRLRAEALLPLSDRIAKKALFEALSHSSIDWGLALRMKGSWLSRFEVLLWMLFPPSPYLRRANAPARSSKLFPLYFRRLGRCVAADLQTQRRRLYEGRASQRYRFSTQDRE